MNLRALTSLIWLAAVPLGAADLLVLRDGTREVGALRTCVAEQCRFEAKTIPLRAITWIGFDSISEADPPSPDDPAIDEVHLLDGTIHPGKLVGVSATKIVNERGSWNRNKVAWLYIASLPSGPSSGAGTKRPQIKQPDKPGEPDKGEEPKKDEPKVDPPPRRPPPPLPPRAPGNAVKPCPASKPLGGHLEIRDRYIDREGYELSTRHRMWFRLEPPVDWQWPSVLSVPWHSRELIWRSAATACVDLPDRDNEICRCNPKSASGRTAMTGVDISFHPMKPELSISLPDEIRFAVKEKLECEGPHSSSSGTSPSGLPSFIGFAPAELGFETMITAATPCAGNTPAPDCVRRPDLYAAIPMSGQDTVVSIYGDDEVTSTMRWEICCGCGEPPRDRPEGENDPCGDPSIQRGLLEVAINNAQRLRDDLRPRFERFQLHWRAAQGLRSKFIAVVASCAGWEIAETILGTLAGEGAPQAVVGILGFLEQVLDQDPSAVLSGAALVGPAEAGAVNDAWTLLTTLAGAASDVSNAASLAGMRSKLEDCAGTPTIDYKLYSDAKGFIDELEQALNEVPDMGRLKTEIVQADTDVFNKYAAWHRACLEDARCRGLDPALCGPAPR